MAEVINDYTLHAPMTNKGAGFAKWGRAEKSGVQYFIKELLNPRYPTRDSPYDDVMKKQILESCEAFEQERIRLYSKLNEISDGNLMRVEEFFCWDGSYYLVTQWVYQAKKADFVCEAATWPTDGDELTVADLSATSQRMRVRVCLALSHAIANLHDAEIVHADIKPSNIMLTPTAGGAVSAKVIDMESGFFACDPPLELVGDQVYFAPESAAYMMGRADKSTIGCAIDVFALGLVFHQILSGDLPALEDDYHYAFESCLDGRHVKANKSIPADLRPVVDKMLASEASERATMSEVRNAFWRHLHGPGKSGSVDSKFEASGGSPGRLFISNDLNLSTEPNSPEKVGQSMRGDEAFYRPKDLT